jgi:hypothetical protein
VNETFVRKFLSGRNPLGAAIAYVHGPGGGTRRTVVGVVGDAVYGSVRERIQPTIYLPLAQQDPGRARTDITIAMRPAAGSPASLAPGAGAAFKAVDPGLTFSFQILADRVNGALIRERLVASLSGIFGAAALLLAAMGLYGITSYSLNRRRPELGIRIALGARAGAILRLVLSRILILVGAGVAIGTALSLWSARLVTTLLYDVEPGDPATLIAAAGLLAVIAAAAAGLPAWRASRMDAAEVLRSE